MFGNKDNRLGKIHSLLWIICVKWGKSNAIAVIINFLSPAAGDAQGLFAAPNSMKRKIDKL